MRDQFSIKKQLIDQGAHLAAAVVILSMFTYFLNTGYPIIGGIFAGLGLGIIREMTEEAEISWSAFVNLFSSFGNVIDLIGWTAGGVLTGVIIRFTDIL